MDESDQARARERDGLFAGDDPLEITRRWLAEAAAQEPNDPDAMALATVDATGLPNLRIVLARRIDAGGVTFFTNYDSAKGREIEATGQGALVMHWKSLRRQIRMRGSIRRAPAEISDRYYASRPLGSRIGAWASRQSQPLASREALVQEVARLERELGEAPPRPPHWGGYCLEPVEIEFWADGAFRLHDRFRWRRRTPGQPWEIARLNP